MAKLIAAVLVTVALVALAMANAHQTQLNYLVGEPITIRVVVLIGICYLAGALSVILARLTSDVKSRHRDRRERARHHHLPILEDDE